FDFGTRTGLVLEGLIVPWCLLHYGRRRTFVVVGLSALLWLIPWLLFAPRNLQTSKEDRAAAPRPSMAQFMSLLKNRNLIGICIGFFCFDYYWYLLVTWLPDYLVTVRQMTILKAGIYASLPFLVFGVSQPVGGWIADELVRRGCDETRTRKGIISVAFLTGLLLIPASLVTSPNAAIAFIVG